MPAIRRVVAAVAEGSQAKNLAALDSLFAHEGWVHLIERAGVNHGWADYRDHHLAPELKEFENFTYRYYAIEPQVRGPVAWTPFRYELVADPLAASRRGRSYQQDGPVAHARPTAPIVSPGHARHRVPLSRRETTMSMHHLFAGLAGLAVMTATVPRSVGAQQGPEAEVRAAVERYNSAFTTRDLASLKALLAPDIILYEHSVKNIGLDDVWDNHLRPEVEAFQDTRAEFTEVRVWVAGDVALVTRQYSIQATMNSRAIDARGNETMGWARRDGAWRVVHIHYSHPCPRPPAG